MKNSMYILNANKKTKKGRGAVSRQVKPSRSFNREKLLSSFSVFISILVAAIFVAAVYKGGDVLLSQPVDRVVVNGEFSYVKKQTIVDSVKPFLDAGFIKLDLHGIHQRLTQLPWVYDVIIERSWPGEIAIKVVEQTPIAKWGKDGFLNHRGDLFVPNSSFNIAGLPVLSGPDEEAERVMSYFRELNLILDSKELALSELQINERGSWSAKLDNDVLVQFGGGEIMQKMQRLLFAFETGLSADFDQIKNIDMRYNNGFAVAWKQQKS